LFKGKQTQNDLSYCGLSQRSSCRPLRTPATISLRMKCFTDDPPFVVEHRAGTQLEEPLRDQSLLDWLIPYSIGNKELPCRLMAIPRPQLGKDMGEVIFHCLWTDVET